MKSTGSITNVFIPGNKKTSCQAKETKLTQPGHRGGKGLLEKRCGEVMHLLFWNDNPLCLVLNFMYRWNSEVQHYFQTEARFISLCFELVQVKAVYSLWDSNVHKLTI